MPARKNKTTLSDTWKERIKSGVILDRLQKHIEGKLELSNTQVAAAKIMLSKVVPDLARSELTGKDGKDLIPASIEIKLISPSAATTT